MWLGLLCYERPRVVLTRGGAPGLGGRRGESGGGGGRQGSVVLTVRIFTKQIFYIYFSFFKYKRLNQIKCADVQCMLWVTADQHK